MENLALKVKLAVLWLFWAELLSAYFLLAFLMPGAIEEIIAGEIGGMPISEGSLLFSALFWLIPLIMAFLSLTLKDSVNRWANIIAGIAFVAFGILALSDTLILVQLTLSMMEASRIVVAFLIVWLAWNWPKQEAVTKPKK